MNRIRELALMLFLGACGVYEDSVTDLGYIHFGGADSVFFSVPDTVALSTPFDVTIRTYGGGCTREGPTHVNTSGVDALVEPYDITNRADVCTLELRSFTHRTTLRVNTAGTSSITVRGRARADSGPDTLATRVRTVIVK